MVKLTWKYGWGDHAKHKAVSTSLAECYHVAQSAKAPVLGKASIFEEISMLTRLVRPSFAVAPLRRLALSRPPSVDSPLCEPPTQR